jgi:3,4-dihydroxy-2-butanone 4-phosphate synthase
MHDQVALVRYGATKMGVDLADFTDLEVLAILRWCEINTPDNLDASKTMVGVIATMKQGD